MISLGQDLAELIVEPKHKAKNNKKIEDTDFYNLWRVNPNEPPQTKADKPLESEKKPKVYVNIVQEELPQTENPVVYSEANSRLKQMALLRQQRQSTAPEVVQEQAIPVKQQLTKSSFDNYMSWFDTNIACPKKRSVKQFEKQNPP